MFEGCNYDHVALWLWKNHSVVSGNVPGVSPLPWTMPTWLKNFLGIPWYTKVWNGVDSQPHFFGLLGWFMFVFMTRICLGLWPHIITAHGLELIWTAVFTTGTVFFCCVPNFRRRRVVVTWQTSHLDNHKDQKGSSGPLRYRREPRVLIRLYPPKDTLKGGNHRKPGKYAGNISSRTSCVSTTFRRGDTGDERSDWDLGPGRSPKKDGTCGDDVSVLFAAIEKGEFIPMNLGFGDFIDQFWLTVYI